MTSKRWLQAFTQSCCDFHWLSFFKAAYKRLARCEKYLLTTLITMLWFFILAMLINHFVTHYYSVFFLFHWVIFLATFLFILGSWASLNRDQYPKSSYFILAIVYTCFASGALGILAMGVMLTPSSWVLSNQLLAIDTTLGFHQLTVMHWMGHHRWLAQSFAWAYQFWHWQVFLVAPILVLCHQFKRACEFLWLSALVGFCCCLIYYIWPSLSPAAVLPQHIFADSCYTCIHRFHLLRSHHHYAFGMCGLIDFPSYHAALAMLTIWAFIKTPMLKWVMLIINVWIILATFLLGFHYLIDVIAAFVLVCLLLWIAKQLILQKSQKNIAN